MKLDDQRWQNRPIRTTGHESRSAGLIDLYGYFAPVRQEILDSGMTEQELDTCIEAAVAAVRANRPPRY